MTVELLDVQEDIAMVSIVDMVVAIWFGLRSSGVHS